MHTLETPPLFHELADCQRILVASAGGGFDVFSRIPLYLALKAQGKASRVEALRPSG